MVAVDTANNINANAMAQFLELHESSIFVPAINHSK